MQMIEKVAKAICLAEMNKRFHSSKVDLINERVEAEFKNYMNAARAAIEAMRKPTEEMKSVSVGSIHWTNEEVWNMFIDAALKDA